MDISKKDCKLFREKLPDWQENYIECLSRACVILEVGLKSASENSGSLL